MGTLGCGGSDCIRGFPSRALLDGKATVVSVSLPGLETVPKGVLRTHLDVHFLFSALPAQKVQTHKPTDFIAPFHISVQGMKVESSLSGVGRRASNPDVVLGHLTGL